MRLRSRVLLLTALLCASAASTQAQWLYVTDVVGDCTVDMMASIVRGQYQLRIYAPDHSNATGVYFRLVVDELGSEDEVIVAPAGGVTYAGDARTGMVSHWSPRALNHESILTISFVDHEPFAEFFPSGWVFAGVREAILLFPAGATLPLEDMDAARIHCSPGGGGLWFDPPVSPEVVIGATSLVAFRGMSTGWYWGPGATNLTAVDSQGWVKGLSPNSLWNSGCGKCPWFWESLALTVSVPQGTSEGIETTVTIREGSYALASFTLIATKPTPVAATTWGAVKALYRH